MIERFKPIFAIAILLAIAPLTDESAFAATVVAWGWNQDGQCNVPAGNDFVAIAARFKHSLALKADGSIVCWGQNNRGQSNPPAGKDFVAIAAGLVHSLALKSDGSLVAWGYNVNGECNVPPGKDFIAIAAGDYHNVAIRSDGSLAAWGENDEGQCNVPSGNGCVAVAAGDHFNVAVRSDGSLVVWGQTICQAFGTLNPSCQPNPPAGNDFVAVAAGGISANGFALALRSDGSVSAWGDNNFGQRNVPADATFTAIAAGLGHGVALKADGSLAAWGKNDFGQCNVPAGNSFIAVASGSSHGLALLKESKTGHPIADAGKDIVARANEEVVLDGRNSRDEDGQITLYTWKRLPDEVIVYSGPEPTHTTRALGRAEEVFELTVTDNDLFTASDTVIIFNKLLDDLLDKAAGE